MNLLKLEVLEVTEPKAAIEHYLFPDRVLEVSGIDFINEVKKTY